MKKLSIIIIALLAILVCCKKTPEVNIKYVDVEREILTIGQTTANIQCDYEYIATLKSAKLYYGISEATSYVEMRVVQSSLYAELSGLNSGTTYQYYYEFTNGFNSMQSGVKNFVTETTPISLPTVITADITGITSDSAIGGGEVTNDGGSNVTTRGICWSTSTNPTIEDSHTTEGTGVGIFTSSLTGLNINTTYHVRAYATNEAGTAYGLDKEFTTTINIPEGAINGLFTINDNGDKVYFSQGNLQYQASTNIWRFAEKQWNYVGGYDPSYSTQLGNVYENGIQCDNTLMSSTYDGWIDLFCWGTSGYNHGADYYEPWSKFGNWNNYYAYGDPLSDLNTHTGQADWGYNAISNGGSTENLWRTLTHDEWNYVFSKRNTNNDIRYSMAIVNGINGVILLPDSWNTTYYNLINPNNETASFNNNIIDLSEWSNTFENHGAVFLPITGHGDSYVILQSNEYGGYWSASVRNENNSIDVVYSIEFVDCNLLIDGFSGRHKHISVRLVQDANK